MNDTVTKLMGIADEYALRCSTAHVSIEPARQALQDELTLLFTPLTDEHVDDLFAAVVDKVNAGEIAYESVGLARAVEAAHGITGEKNANA